MGMKTYVIPLQENGRLILPIELRRALGVDRGDRVVVEAEDDRITLTTMRLRRRRAQETAARYVEPGRSVVDEFLAEKRHEAERENRSAGGSAESAA